MKTDAGGMLFRITKLQMTLTGTWQHDTELSEKKRFFFKCYSIFFFSVTLYATITLFMGCCECLLVQKDIEHGFELLSYFILLSISTWKTCLCQTRKMTELIREGIRQCNEEASADYRIMRIYLKYINLSNFLPLFLFCYNMFTDCIYFRKMFRSASKFRKEHDHGQQALYLLGSWCPFNKTTHFSYCLTIEVIGTPFLACYNSVSQALFITIITLSVAQMRVLQYNFKQFCCNGLMEGKAVSQEDMLANLKKCVRRHQKIISYIGSINESWKYILLLEYVTSSVMFAGALLKITESNDQLFSMFYFGLIVIQLTAICLIAEELHIQSLNISDALYQSKWYDYNNKEMKQIMLIVMMRSRRPLSLTIGPFGPLTTNVILTRLRLAYSYMSLMQSGI